MPWPTLRDLLPEQNFRDDPDVDFDLTKFVEQVLQLVLDELGAEQDAWGEQIDPDSASANTVGAMLLDLGCPFPIALTLPIAQQRSLVKELLAAYKSFGTPNAIVNMVRALTGVESSIVAPARLSGWILGERVLGLKSVPFDPSTTNFAILGNGPSSSKYSFQLVVASPLTADQQAVIREIVRGVKPAHTHFYGFLSNAAPPPAWRLGVSHLGAPGETVLGALFE